MDRKALSTGKKLLLILLFSVSVAVFAIGVGNLFRCVEATTVVYTMISGVVYIVTFTLLLRDYKPSKKKKTTSWYIDKYLIGFLPVVILTGLMFVAFGESDDGKIPLLYIGLAMFPSVGILVAPNGVRYSKKDMQGWKTAVFEKGNLRQIPRSDTFCKITEPLTFHGKLVFIMLMKRIRSTILGIILVTVFSFGGTVLIPLLDSVRSDGAQGLFSAVLHVKAVRAEGFVFFMILFFVTFGIPILAYNLTNTILTMKRVCRREYVAYRACVAEMKDGKVYIHHKEKIYSSKDVSCVGIRQKDVHDRNVILVFVPDAIYLFPEEYGM